MSVTVRRQQVDLTAWQLIDQSDMVAALTALKASGWRGAISYDDTRDSWRLELNADNPTRQVIATVGDWLVLDIGLRKLTAGEFDENYDEAGS